MKYPTSSMTATSGAPTPNRPESDPSKLSDVDEEIVDLLLLLLLLWWNLGRSSSGCCEADDGLLLLCRCLNDQ